MKLMRTEDAVGQVLCHDITQIIKGVTKDAVFRKGHIITEEDIPVLLSVGKDHIYIWENNENMLHENDAAKILYDMCVNALGEMMIACRHGNFPVKKGDKIAGTRIIPLVIEKEKMERAKKAAGEKPIFELIPFKKMKAAIVNTGNEVFYGRIKDTFTPVIIEKLKEYGAEVVGHVVSDDNHEHITAAIQKFLDEGVDMVLCTGGMSVDPDDRTPLAIKNTGAEIVTYGAPVLPGAMFLLSYYGEKKRPVIGLPGCVMYAKRTIFDLVLPRIVAGEILKKADIDTLGEGGLCLNCPVCTFPNCGFGK